MGIKLASKTIEREKRYMGLSVSKNNDGTNQGNIRVATGYYDLFNGVSIRVTEKEEVIYLNNSQLNILFSIKPSQLGLTSSNTNLFSMLDTAIYAIVSGLIALKFKLLLTVIDEQSNPIENFTISIKTGNTTAFSNYSNVSTTEVEGDVLIAPTIEIVKDGYQTLTFNLQVLQGDVVLTKTLVANPPEPVV